MSDKKLAGAPVPGRIVQLMRLWSKTVFLQEFKSEGKPAADFLLYGVAPGVIPVLVLPITTDGGVVAQREFRYGANGYILEIPGGCGVDGEEPINVARRELLEETGYAPRKLIDLGTAWIEPATFRVQHHLFVATGCVPVKEPSLDATEIISIEHYPVRSWVDMCMSSGGTVVDMKSIAITMRALRHLYPNISSII